MPKVKIDPSKAGLGAALGRAAVFMEARGFGDSGAGDDMVLIWARWQHGFVAMATLGVRPCWW